jgi:hypothetical protein
MNTDSIHLEINGVLNINLKILLRQFQNVFNWFIEVFALEPFFLLINLQTFYPSLLFQTLTSIII